MALKQPVNHARCGNRINLPKSIDFGPGLTSQAASRHGPAPSRPAPEIPSKNATK
jgi:hypothetical protein